MFGKLLKHEFRAQRGLLGWLTVAVLAAGCIGMVAVQLLIHIFRDEMYAVETAVNEGIGIFLTIAAIALFFLVTLLFIAIISYATASGWILYYRFYKHHFTDEGYLTFTLPATTHQILLSSIVNILIWSMIAVAAVLISLGLMCTPLFILAYQETGMIMPSFKEIFVEVYGANFGIKYALAVLCGVLGQMILPLLAITIGALVTKKHKLLAGIGIYLGLNSVVSFISGFVSAVLSIASMLSTDSGMAMEKMMSVAMLVPAVLYLGIAVGGYFLMHHLIKNKLNLT